MYIYIHIYTEIGFVVCISIYIYTLAVCRPIVIACPQDIGSSVHRELCLVHCFVYPLDYKPLTMGQETRHYTTLSHGRTHLSSNVCATGLGEDPWHAGPYAQLQRGHHRHAHGVRREPAELMVSPLHDIVVAWHHAVVGHLLGTDGVPLP